MNIKHVYSFPYKPSNKDLLNDKITEYFMKKFEDPSIS